ncbi:cysteine proteinase [Ceratobasidium sp. AG-I]|nr:cysteine proteinase [Ceratobasidium sp. AG-I]
MTQLEPTPESSPQQPKHDVPKDITQRSSDRPTPQTSETAPGAASEASNQDIISSNMDNISSLNLSYEPADGYRAPEAVPNSDPAFIDNTNGGWADSFNNPWEVSRATDWDNRPGSPTGRPGNSEWSDRMNLDQQWGERPPNPDNWKNLGVIGTDEPWGNDPDKWWDKDLQLTRRKPGPGMLAPRAIEIMHDSDHILYEVSITGNPSAEPSATLSHKTSVRSIGALNAPNPPTPTASTSASPAAGTTETTPEPAPEVIPHVIPTSEELRDATPHPSALFCRRHFGWVVISIIAASATASHLGSHWCSDPDKKAIFDTLPDPALRNDKDCLERETSPSKASLYGTINWSTDKEPKMHHFHVYRNVVAGSGLYPPLKRQISTISPPLPVTSSNAGGDVDMASQSQVLEADDKTDDAPETSWKEAPPAEHLDLYMCCQCKTQVVCSPDGGVIPCVIPADVIEGFIRERGSQPKPGQTSEQSVFMSLEMIMRIIEEPLWVGNTKALTITGKAFNNKIGWSDSSRRIFEAMDFTMEDNHLSPPSLENTTPKGRASRSKLLRIWVEVGALLAYYSSRNSSLKSIRTNYIRINGARENIAKHLGSHSDQVPRLEDMSVVSDIPEKLWDVLGITKSTATATVVETAYNCQTRCNPPETPTYYDALSRLSQQQKLPGISEIQSLAATESSRGRWTEWDLQSATEDLGFGVNGVIGETYVADEANDEYILSAFQSAFKAAANEPAKRRRVKNSLRIIAESRGSHQLMRQYERVNSANFIDIDEAYKILDVTKDVDDDTLVVVYQVRIADSPHSKPRMNEALTCVAEERNSARLKELISTGVDPGKPPVIVPAEFPRGLHQLGNTCYLNSLLQYFYTIKELREVIENGSFDLDAPISDEDLLNRRIGGRLVTRREVERSKKFVKLLSGLFMQMMCVDEAAITPELELAKLALVTSKDEEDDAIAEAVTTEPGEISEKPAGATEQITAPPGDTPKVEGTTENSIAVEPKEKDAGATSAPDEIPDAMMASRPASPPAALTAIEDQGDSKMDEGTDQSATIVVPVTQIESSQEDERLEADTSGNSMIVETGDEPPSNDLIAARKKSTMVADSGAMMFGKQHDVSEVFDNCMFQIETALQFEPGSEGDARSGTIKKLFYGKLLQRLRPIFDPTASPTTSLRSRTVHEKEDLFSHLLVNVSDEGFDLYDGLNGYLEDEVEYAGKRSRMEVSLLDLPPILQIQLQRVQFNRDTMQAFKSNAYIKFEETLSMDRFMADVDPEKKAQSKIIESELSACRERLRALTSGNSATLTTSLAGTKAFLATLGGDHLDIDSDLANNLGEEIKSVEEEVRSTRAQSQKLKGELEEFWKEQRQVEYELASVFIHRGTSASFGHYFFYSRHLPGKPDEWFKYNDSEVTPVNKTEVLADGTGSTANPYLLVYVRKGYEIVDTVHRITTE